MDLHDPYGLNKYLLQTTALEQMLQFADPTKSVANFAVEQQRIRDLVALQSNASREILDRLSADAASYNRLLNQAGQFDDHLKALQKSVALDGALQAIQASFANLDSLRHLWDSSALVRDFDRWNARTFPDFQIDWEAARARFAKSLAFAAMHGWFLTGERDEDLALPIEDFDDDVEVLDQLFEEHVEGLVDCIDTRLQQDFAPRREFIAEAFALFRERRYAAAIPLLLLTADGIAHDAAGRSAFSTIKTSDGRTTGLATWVEEQLDATDLEPYIDQLAKPHALSASNPSRFSRHAVLHGRDLDYGSRRNALQAISFLGFLAWMVVEVRGVSDPSGNA